MATNNQNFMMQVAGGPAKGLLFQTGKEGPAPLISLGANIPQAWGKQYTSQAKPPAAPAPDEDSLFQRVASMKTALPGQKPAAAAPAPAYDTPYDAYIGSLSAEQRRISELPVANKGVGGGNVGALSAEMDQYAKAGINFGTASGNSAKQIARMAPDLARYGVASLNDLEAVQMPSPTGKGTVDVFHDRRTGRIIPTEFGSSMKGEGGSTYRLRNFNGRVVPVAVWKDTSEAKSFAPLAMAASLGAGLLLGPAAAAIGNSLSSGLGLAAGSTAASVASAAGSAVASGVVQGGISALSGGDFGKGFLTGAVGSGIGSAVGGINPGSYATSNATLGNAINKALSGGLGGAAGAAISGRDAAGGALQGFIQGGVSALAGPLVGQQAATALGSLASRLGAGLLGSGGSQPASAGGGGAPQQPTAAVAQPAATGFGTGASLTPGQGHGYGVANQLAPRSGVGMIARA